jgi:acyl-CoA thioester hydrolase
VLNSRSTIRVRYSETDMMGVVYHGSYLPWLEVARTDLFRNFGLSYRQFETEGYHLPVLSVSCRYIRPAIYDDEVEIEVTAREKPRLRIKLDYTIRRGDERLATATTEHAFIDQTGRPTRPPAAFTKLIEENFVD